MPSECVLVLSLRCRLLAVLALFAEDALEESDFALPPHALFPFPLLPFPFPLFPLPLFPNPILILQLSGQLTKPYLAPETKIQHQ